MGGAGGREGRDWDAGGSAQLLAAAAPAPAVDSLPLPPGARLAACRLRRPLGSGGSHAGYSLHRPLPWPRATGSWSACADSDASFPPMLCPVRIYFFMY